MNRNTFYIIFGVLKVSGTGLSGLGKNVIEGMTDKQEKKLVPPSFLRYK